MSKIDALNKLMDNTMATLREKNRHEGSAWFNFLHTAAWNYKYPFPTQVLIYAQRPNATACGNFTFWTSPQMANRHIRAGAKGIAVLNDSHPDLSIEYLYDVTDTTARRNSRPIPIWHMTPESEPLVRQALAHEYFPDSAIPGNTDVLSQTDFFRLAASQAVHARMAHMLPLFLNLRPEGAFRGLTDERAREEVETFLINSVTACAMLRCELEPQLPDYPFVGAAYFSGNALSLAGSFAQEISFDLIHTAGMAVRSWERQNTQNQPAPAVQAQEQNEIPEESIRPDAEKETKAISQEDILHAIRAGGRLEDNKYRICLSNSKSPADLELTLQGEYGFSIYDTLTLHYPDGKLGSVVPDKEGLHINKAQEDGAYLTWTELAKSISADIAHGQYLDEIETERYNSWLSELQSKEARAAIGSQLHALLSTWGVEKSKSGYQPQLVALKEHIRAFVYDKSDSAKEALLRELERVRDTSSFPPAVNIALDLISRLAPSEEPQTPLPKQVSYHSQKALGQLSEAAVKEHPISEADMDHILREFSPGDWYQDLLDGVLSAQTDDQAVQLLEQMRYHVNSCMVSMPDNRIANVSFQTAGLRIVAGGQREYLSYADAAMRIRQVRTIAPAKEPIASVPEVSNPAAHDAQQQDREDDISPKRAEELLAGDIISLPGGRFLVMAATDTSVTLQLEDNPLFSQAMSISLLNTLLENAEINRKAQQLHTISEVEPEVESADTVSVKELGDTEKMPVITGTSAISDASDMPESNPASQSEPPSDKASTPHPEELQQNAPKQSSEPEPEERSSSVKEPVRRTGNAARAYDFMMSYAPELLDDTRAERWRSLRLEDEVFEPVNIDRISERLIAISHTYKKFGDTMCDPEMVFVIDHDNRTLRPFSFEQSDMSLYQLVYDLEDTEFQYPDKQLERDLLSFFRTWSNNLKEQGHHRVYAITMDGEELDLLPRMQEEITQIPEQEATALTQAPTIPAAAGAAAEDILNHKAGSILLAQDASDNFLNKTTDEIFSYFLEHTDEDRIDYLKQQVYKLGTFYEFGSEHDRKGFVPRQEDVTVWTGGTYLNNTGSHTYDWPTAHALITERLERIKEGERAQRSGLDYVAPTPVHPEVTEPTLDKETDNYRLPRTAEILGGPKERFRHNIRAIQLLKTLELEDRAATHAEQETLDRYVGWGGLQEAFNPKNESWQKEYQQLKALLTPDEYSAARESTLTSFYTPPEVTHAIFAGLSKFGFTKGNILDPCCGTGKFLGSVPNSMRNSKLYAVEKDSISGRIAKKLYPDANIQIQGYEDTNLQDNLFDVAVGNVPFDNVKLHDPRYNKLNLLIHDYFFAKTLDKVRPGGIVAFVTSQGTLDKKNTKFREYLSERADLLGAIRLPNDTFKGNAGTDVTTDILFLQKRERPAVERADWVDLDRPILEDRNGEYRKDPETGELLLGPETNKYFVDHPEMILGTMQEVSGPFGTKTVCQPKPGHDLANDLQRALYYLDGSMQQRPTSGPEEEEDKRRSIPADPSVRNFSFTIWEDDKLYFREDSEMFEVETNKTAALRIRGLIQLRETLYELIAAQTDNEPDERVEELQNRLNSQYDAFVKKYGIINNRGNDLAFSDDSSYYLLCALENLDPKTREFKSKADIFFKRTISAHNPVTHTDTSREALAVSIGERGCVDFRFMSMLCGKDEAALKQELRGEIFPDPEHNGRFVLAATYLSGNIRSKLQYARQAAQSDPNLYADNVKALEEAMPVPLEPGDISARLGATWIPADIVTQFMYELLNTPDYFRKEENTWSRLAVFYNEIADIWTVKNKDHSDKYNQIANSKYGTKRASAYRLLEDCLNLKNTKIYDTEFKHGKDTRVINADETLEAQSKQELIQQAFQDWVWKDVDRADRLCTIYNEKFNSYRPPTYDGDMVVFHGMNPNIQLRPHQKNAIARMLFGGNTLLDHDVGAGKTWTMVASAMESKRLGLCNKTIITVPNHLIGQWASNVYQLYPSANILAATRRDFETKGRKKFCSRIATGDYDIVIIGHSQFGLIPVSAERQKAGIKDQIEDISAAIQKLREDNGEDFSIKQLERIKKQLQTKADKLYDKKQDDVITFEQLGADRLYVDESDEFKNLFLFTKMHNVAGISQTDSQRASDLFLKCRYMDELTGYKGTTFASGTSISNSIAEMYTIQRYLQYNVLEEAGLTSFDAWAANFGEVVNSIELAPEGTGFRARTRFAKFNNLPELLSMFHLFADTQTRDMMDLPLPNVQYDTVALPPSDAQKQYVKAFGDRADRIRKGGVDPSEDNMLCITNDGRKLALDQRLIDPTLPDEPNSKVNACAQIVYDRYLSGSGKKLTQVIFCDISTPKKGVFNVYDDLKSKLMAKGIPENEIRFVHEAKTETQKEALFNQVRTGEVRVLMGSTGKLGTGTNIQDLLSDGYDLDCPWRPRDLEQRAGRVVRQGNSNEQVRITRFVKEGTFDAYLYQIVETKQRFIDQIRNGSFTGRSAADISQASLNYAEIKALSTGDPRIREKVELEIEVSKLNVLANRHKNEQLRLQKLIERTLPERIASLEGTISRLTRDCETLDTNPERDADDSYVPACVHGRCFETLDECGAYLYAALKKVPEGESIPLGTLRGLAIHGVKTESDSYFQLGNEYRVDVNFYNASASPSDSNRLSNSGLLRRFHSILSTMPWKLSAAKDSLADTNTLFDTSKSAYGRPFPQESVLTEKRQRLNELNKLLDLDHSDQQAQGTQQEVSRDKDSPAVISPFSSLDDMLRHAAARNSNSSDTGHHDPTLDRS